MNLFDLRRLLQPIQNKILLLVGRSIIKYIESDISNSHQKIQVTCLKDETLSNLDRMQEYGLETYPKEDSEGICLFIGGNRGHGIIIVVGDRRYRLLDLVEGEVALYTSEDSGAGGHRIHLKNGQSIDIKGTSVTINCGIQVTGGDINTNQNIIATGDVSDSNVTTPTMINIRTLYNTHTHNFINAHGIPSITDEPIQKM